MDLSFGRAFRAVRMLRALHVSRIVRRLETLRVMVLMIGNAMINVVWAFIVLVTYMAPIFFMQLTTTTPPCLKMVVVAIPLIPLSWLLPPWFSIYLGGDATSPPDYCSGVLFGDSLSSILLVQPTHVLADQCMRCCSI